MAAPVSPRVLMWWYGLMAIAGMFFGGLSPQRPFGDDVLAHPLVVFAGAVALALIALRTIAARPVPEIIPERMLMYGFGIGLAAFLAGNYVVVHLVRV